MCTMPTRRLGDNDVARMLARIPHPYPEADAEAFIAREPTEEQVFAIERKDDGVFLGAAGITPAEDYEFGYWLGKPFWGFGYSTEAVTDTILRRMPDYVHYICPQFGETDINFQRIPTVDTSNPFIARWIPTPDESMVVIRLKNPRGIDFPYLLSMIPNSFMSRANSIVIHGAKLDLAMQLILTPLILQLIDRKRRA